MVDFSIGGFGDVLLSPGKGDWFPSSSSVVVSSSSSSFGSLKSGSGRLLTNLPCCTIGFSTYLMALIKECPKSCLVHEKQPAGRGEGDSLQRGLGCVVAGLQLQEVVFQALPCGAWDRSSVYQELHCFVGFTFLILSPERLEALRVLWRLFRFLHVLQAIDLEVDVASTKIDVQTWAVLVVRVQAAVVRLCERPFVVPAVGVQREGLHLSEVKCHALVGVILVDHILVLLVGSAPRADPYDPPVVKGSCFPLLP